ncbi:N-acetylmuramoyl-L-alanine amidase [Eubacteriales bacterium OttesenSCG-928-K08]|nr:N-acetylmuramoyl-L-alanine amidase [Eubacteriales bacterium OttesenSCG-928-K08]
MRKLISITLVLFCLLLCGCSSVVATGQRELLGLTILIDPGHGDTDVGTIGVSTGAYEKDTNLQIAKKLKLALEEHGVIVLMTREDDNPLGPADETDLALRKEADMLEREKIISEAKANLLVSIHQNAYDEPDVKGPQVFYLQYNNKSYGVEFAKSLQNALNNGLKPDSPRNVGSGNWRLLKQGKQPGCIVECGFFSNPEEELLLQQDDYQNKIVEALVKGIETYVKKYGA